MEKVNEYKFELACCIALSAVGINFWRELQVNRGLFELNAKTRKKSYYSLQLLFLFFIKILSLWKHIDSGEK